MSGGLFKSNRGKFERNNLAFKDLLLGHMAMDVEVSIKVDGRTPVSATKAMGNARGGGHMKAEVRHFKLGEGKYQVVSGKNYSAVQEAGERNGRKFKHYSTPGTGPGWFKAALDKVWRRREQYALEARRALGL